VSASHKRDAMAMTRSHDRLHVGTVSGKHDEAWLLPKACQTIRFEWQQLRAVSKHRVRADRLRDFVDAGGRDPGFAAHAPILR